MGLDPESHAPIITPPLPNSTYSSVESMSDHHFLSNLGMQNHLQQNTPCCMQLEPMCRSHEHTNNLQIVVGPSTNLLEINLLLDGNDKSGTQSIFEASNHTSFGQSTSESYIESNHSNCRSKIQEYPKVDGPHRGVDQSDSSLWLEAQRSGCCMHMENSYVKLEPMKPSNYDNINYNNSIKLHPCCKLVVGQEGNHVNDLERQICTTVHYKREDCTKENYKHSAKEGTSRLTTNSCGENLYMNVSKSSKENPKACPPHGYNLSLPYILTTNEDTTLLDSPLNPRTPLVLQEDRKVPFRTANKNGGEIQSCQVEPCTNYGKNIPLEYLDDQTCSRVGEHDNNCDSFNEISMAIPPFVDHEDCAEVTWNMLEGEFVWHQGGMLPHTNIDQESFIPILGSPLVGDSSLLWGTYEDNMLFSTRDRKSVV